MAGTPEDSLPAHVYFFNHVHSRHSKDNGWAKPLKFSAAKILRHTRDFLAERNQTGMVAVTDHNDDRSFDEIEGEARDGRVTSLRSVEWGLGSHLGMIGVVPQWEKLPDYAQYKHLSQLEVSRGVARLRIVNHPNYRGREWPLKFWGDADAVEVWNTPYEERPFVLAAKSFSRSNNRLALAQWVESLKNTLVGGRKYPAVAGSDFHFNAPCVRERFLLYPTNVVLSADNRADRVTDAIAQGRVSIVVSPESPKLFLRAAVGKEVRDIGGTIVAAKAAKIHVTATGDFLDARARLEPGCYEGFKRSLTRRYPLDRDRFEVRVFQGTREGKPVWTGTMRREPFLSTLKLELDWSGAGRDYIRAELWRVQKSREELAGFTNPIHLSATP